MRIGDLRDKIDFMIKASNVGPVESLEPEYEETILNIWAKKVRLLGREAIKLGLDHNTVQVNFIIRVRNDIAEDMYIKHGNIIYNIIGFEELKGDRNYMLIATVKKQVII